MTQKTSASQPEHLNKIQLCNLFIFAGIILLSVAAAKAYQTRGLPFDMDVPLMPVVLLGLGLASLVCGNFLGRSIK